MSKFLFAVWPYTGHTYPNMAIAQELQKAGHEVAFYSGSAARATIAGAGFSFFPFRRVNEARINRIVLAPDGILSLSTRPLRLRAMWREWVLDSVPAQVADLREILDSWQPDAIVSDPSVWAPFLVLREQTGIPVAIFSLIPACHLSGPDGPILGFPLPRARNGWERLRARSLRALSDLFLRGLRREASGLRRSFGLPPLRQSVTDFAASMPLYLVPSCPEFDYQRRDLPPSVHYVGPCLWQAARPEPLPEWVAGLPPGEPLIYASEGTVHLEPRLLRAVAQSMAGKPVQVILTTGKHRDPAQLDLGLASLPPNIHVRQWVPLYPLLPRLSALVTIGGPSTLMAGFEAGVPAVVVPFTWDHPETAWRVEACGAGLRLGPRDCNPEQMGRAIQRVLSEPSFRQNAQRLAANLKRCGGAGAAAGRIAGLVAQPLACSGRTNA